MKQLFTKSDVPSWGAELGVYEQWGRTPSYARGMSLRYLTGIEWKQEAIPLRERELFLLLFLCLKKSFWYFVDNLMRCLVMKNCRSINVLGKKLLKDIASMLTPLVFRWKA